MNIPSKKNENHNKDIRSSHRQWIDKNFHPSIHLDESNIKIQVPAALNLIHKSSSEIDSSLLHIEPAQSLDLDAFAIKDSIKDRIDNHS